MDKIIDLLCSVAELAGVSITKNKIVFIDRGCPHRPVALPKGKMGIYMFRNADEFLKIGKAGPKSSARFQSQPYNPKSSKSNLAKSLLNDYSFGLQSLDEYEIGKWMQEHLHRYDILIDESVGIFVLNLFEAVLHCKYRPKYEGLKAQKR